MIEPNIYLLGTQHGRLVQSNSFSHYLVFPITIQAYTDLVLLFSVIFRIDGQLLFVAGFLILSICKSNKRSTCCSFLIDVFPFRKLVQLYLLAAIPISEYESLYLVSSGCFPFLYRWGDSIYHLVQLQACLGAGPRLIFKWWKPEVRLREIQTAAAWR